MHMILRTATGQLVNGLLLAAGRGRMRVVVEGQKETVELRRARGKWLSDDRSRMEIAFVLTETAVHGVSGGPSQRVAGAAS